MPEDEEVIDAAYSVAKPNGSAHAGKSAFKRFAQAGWRFYSALWKLFKKAMMKFGKGITEKASSEGTGSGFDDFARRVNRASREMLAVPKDMREYSSEVPRGMSRKEYERRMKIPEWRDYYTSDAFGRFEAFEAELDYRDSARRVERALWGNSAFGEPKKRKPRRRSRRVTLEETEED